MKIAICDDEPLFIQQLQQMIQQLYPLPELMIDTFTAGEQLLDKIIRSQIAYQLILLDIEMDGDNGLHIARRLQQMHYEAPVVFITSHQEFALDGYEVNALRFLTKPVSPQKLLEALQTAGRTLQQQKTILLEAREGTHLIKIQNLICVEARNQDLIFYLPDKQLTRRETLSKYETLLQDMDFVRCHRSYLVNLNAVKQLTVQDVLLTNNMRVPVSRLRRKTFAAALHRYVQQAVRM